MNIKQHMIDDLLAKYAKYGITRHQLEHMFEDGLRAGISLKAVEVGIRWGLAHEFKTGEQFTVEDVMAATGETAAEVEARIEALPEQYKA